MCIQFSTLKHDNTLTTNQQSNQIRLPGFDLPDTLNRISLKPQLSQAYGLSLNVRRQDKPKVRRKFGTKLNPRDELSSKMHLQMEIEFITKT